MELDSKIGKVLRFRLECSKKEFDRAIAYYFSLRPEERVQYAKDILIDNAPEGRKSFHTYVFTTEIPTDNSDTVEQGIVQLRTNRDAEVSSMAVGAKLKEAHSDVADGYWNLGQIHFGRKKLEADVKITEVDGQHLSLEDPNVAPLLEVVDGVVIDKLNENIKLRKLIGKEAIELMPPDFLS